MKLPNSFFRKRSVWGLGLAACAFLFGAADGMAQHYVHGTSATLSNNATGVIRLRNSASEFRNFAPATTNIVNAGVMCPPAPGDNLLARTHVKFEAPIGKYEWLSRHAFVGTLALAPAGKGPPAVRVRVYRVR